MRNRTWSADECQQIAERVLSRTRQVETGCIEWTGPTGRGGYARLTVFGRTWQAHRAIWTALRGPIPDDDDWTIDHLCRNPPCQNVDHMEVVLRAENSRRGEGRLRAAALARAKPFCKRGHPLTPESVWRTGDGHRICKGCQQARLPAEYARRREQRRRHPKEPKPRALQETCKRGHPFDRVHRTVDGGSVRRCSTCIRIHREAGRLRRQNR